MTERLIIAAALAAAMIALLERFRDRQAPFSARLLLTGLLSWTALGWALNVRVDSETFPLTLTSAHAAGLQISGILLGAATFAMARGRRGLATGAFFGLIASFIGWCASRWPQLACAINLCGGVFISVVVTTLLMPTLAMTYAALAAALLREDRRTMSRRIVFCLVSIWALATFGTEATLSRVWGFGPRSLAAAAGVPTNQAAATLAVAWLYPTPKSSYHIEARRMSSETADLAPGSIKRIEAFLSKNKFRGIFATEALAAVRLGHLQRWDEKRALDALMLAVPGRVYPDYLRALQLLRAGPVTDERYAKLSRLDAATGSRVEGFETARDSQLIFEGFTAAYARFGDEAKARKWLARLDGLWAVSNKRIEIGPLEDLREGRVSGSLLLNDRSAAELRVGLFLVWRSSATKSTEYWLSGSRVPARDGRFVFDNLGPGRYALALLGSSEALRGEFTGVPGFFEVTYLRPQIILDPIRIQRPFEPAATVLGPAAADRWLMDKRKYSTIPGR